MGMSDAAHQENVMQSTLIVAAIAATLSLPVFAQANTPGIDQRQMNQERRIDQGIASGQLTEREAIHRARASVTSRERERIRRGAIHRARVTRASGSASVGARFIAPVRAGAHP
jgi:hypothetical protein